ncbi:MAG: hypothetical protein AB7F32_06595 [Victivallaceae bacterium]
MSLMMRLMMPAVLFGAIVLAAADEPAVLALPEPLAFQAYGRHGQKEPPPDLAALLRANRQEAVLTENGRDLRSTLMTRLVPLDPDRKLSAADRRLLGECNRELDIVKADLPKGWDFVNSCGTDKAIYLLGEHNQRESMGIFQLNPERGTISKMAQTPRTFRANSERQHFSADGHIAVLFPDQFISSSKGGGTMGIRNESDLVAADLGTGKFYRIGDLPYEKIYAVAALKGKVYCLLGNGQSVALFRCDVDGENREIIFDNRREAIRHSLDAEKTMVRGTLFADPDRAILLISLSDRYYGPVKLAVMEPDRPAGCRILKSSALKYPPVLTGGKLYYANAAGYTYRGLAMDLKTLESTPLFALVNQAKLKRQRAFFRFPGCRYALDTDREWSGSPVMLGPDKVYLPERTGPGVFIDLANPRNSPLPVLEFRNANSVYPGPDGKSLWIVTSREGIFKVSL